MIFVITWEIIKFVSVGLPSMIVRAVHEKVSDSTEWSDAAYKAAGFCLFFVVFIVVMVVIGATSETGTTYPEYG